MAHFFRRAFNLVRTGGAFGLIATNTIGQGDTRSTGLRWICNHRGTIYAARKRLKWPGEAAVVVSVVHTHKGPIAGPYDLDGRSVKLITAFLFPSGGHDDPERLHSNAGKSFQGSIVLGMGFTFDDTDKKGIASPITRMRAEEMAKSGERPISMEELIERDSKYQERIFPYIGGKEVNDSSAQMHHRYVINFAQMSEEEARRWPDLMKIVEERVKGTRGSHSTAEWWHFERFRGELYNAIRGLCRALVNCQVSPHIGFAFKDINTVFAHTLDVFAHDGTQVFASPSVLHPRTLGPLLRIVDERRPPVHSLRLLRNLSLPRRLETSTSLEAIGQEYYDFRAQLMRESNKGLTKTYNRFHDPKERSPEIVRLRDLHTAMDRAVLAAYGWSEIDTTCGFDLDWCESEAADDASPDTLERLEKGNTFLRPPRKPERSPRNCWKGAATSCRGATAGVPRSATRSSPALLLLNKERAEAERLAGLSPLASVAIDDDDELEDGAEGDGESDEDE